MCYFVISISPSSSLNQSWLFCHVNVLNFLDYFPIRLIIFMKFEFFPLHDFHYSIYVQCITLIIKWLIKISTVISLETQVGITRQKSKKANNLWTPGYTEGGIRGLGGVSILC
jgi:hypothetical protein